MKHLFVLCHLAGLLTFGCASQAQARPAARATVTAPQSDKLRLPGPAVFVTLPDLRARIRSSQQKIVLLHMWATWCGPCMQEMPVMVDLARALPARGFELLSVAMDEDTKYNAALVGKVIDGRAQGMLTRAIAKYQDADAFVAGLDPQWEGSIPALLAFSRTGALVGALYGEASRAELDRFLAELEPEMKRTPPATSSAK
jgi:thiol-disulfide isomerase/thioredoxin